MKISKTALWFSVIDALLVLLASASGILLKSIYARETPSWAVQGIGQDIVNLVAVVVLCIAAYCANKGSVKAFLVWSGVLLYLLYAYLIYAFDIHFNSLFLVYVAIVGLSFYALVGSVIQMHLDSLQTSFSATIPARLVSVFFLVLGTVFSLVWLREEILALVTGAIPPGVIEANLPTNPVHILDLGLYLPAMLITALMLWRRKLPGYLFAGPLLVFSTLMGTAILVIFLIMSWQGMSTSVGVEAFFVVIIVVSFILSVLFLREVKEQRREGLTQEPLRILVIGAGVIGSVYATRLQAAGSNVTLLARGQHAADLRSSGLVLEDASTGQASTSHPQMIERLVPEDRYDLALVCVRLDQVATIIPDLAANQHIPTLVFFLNNPTGTELLVEHLGSQRVVLGFPGVGGTREGTRVRYVFIRQQPTTLGEVDGQMTARLRRLSAMLEQAGFSTAISRSMDSWLKTHAVFVSCVSAALALEGGDSVQLGQNRASVALMVSAIREGFAAVQSLGIRVTPFNLKVIFSWMPHWYAVRYWQRALQTDMGTLAIAPHAKSAREEMGQVAREILVFLEPSPVLVPTLKHLLGALIETAPALQSPQE
jgi:2-dehydropantoate 2-reductase